jgi:2-(1,2-epoxy-1,2-dihydrophenyl)acetyl-CoA isomerase
MGTVNEAYADGVCTLTLNRPDKKNAMSLELLKGLADALESAERHGAHIVVIRGAGKTFCAGGDVIEFRDSARPATQIDEMADFLNRSILKIRSMDAIVVAVVEGLAFGAGVSLSLACDLTVAEKKAIMNMAYRRIGLTPDGGGSIFMPRLAGMKRFNEFYFLSRNITMQEAKELGLVNRVCPEEELESTLAALIQELKALPPETTRKAKELVNLSLWGGLEAHLDRERSYVSQFAGTPEFQERLTKLFKKA